MAHPAVIRTEFASAEDFAKAYRLPASRVKTIQKALTERKRQEMPLKKSGKSSAKSTPRGKKQSARKK
jgi:hypothetical protein